VAKRSEETKVTTPTPSKETINTWFQQTAELMSLTLSNLNQEFPQAEDVISFPTVVFGSEDLHLYTLDLYYQNQLTKHTATTFMRYATFSDLLDGELDGQRTDLAFLSALCFWAERDFVSSMYLMSQTKHTPLGALALDMMVDLLQIEDFVEFLEEIMEDGEDT
jgi:hypothetical protein